MNILQNYSKPYVLIFSNPSGLSLALVNNLLSNFCKVLILTKNLEGWHKNAVKINDRSSLEIFDASNAVTESISPNYIIFISSSIEHRDNEETDNDLLYLDMASHLNLKHKAPTFYVLSYLIYPDVKLETIEIVEKIVKENSDLSGVIYLPELLGDNMNLSESRLTARILKDISESRSVRVPQNDLNIYALSTQTASIQIIKNLFSFGGLGERVGLIPEPVRLSNILTILKSSNPLFTFEYISENFNHPEQQGITKNEFIESDFKDIFLSTLSWVLPKFTNYDKTLDKVVEVPAIRFTNTEELTKVKKKRSFEQSRFSRSNYLSKLNPVFRKKIFLSIFTIIIFLFLTPYVFLALGGVGVFFTRSQILSGNLETAKKVNKVSSSLFAFSKKEFDILDSIPIVGPVFEGGLSLTKLSGETTTILSRGFVISDLTSGLLEKILSGKGKDTSYYSRSLSLELGILYEELSFLESDAKEASGIVGYFYNKLIGDLDLKNIRLKASYANSFVKELPNLLGEGERKVYFVLFQNNMELRPTGGFIGSFALLTFDGGKLTDVFVQDVYDADGQLTGHVEPPDPIKRYLKEGGWYLRDSNWDPDFMISAESAEWFLDKELDQKVDGVTGIDLEFAKRLIDVIGPIKLKDFNKEISGSNIYKTVQAEVESDFFPGSRKKSSFLTALSRELLDKVLRLNKSDYFTVGNILLASLDEKHVQVSLSNVSAQKAISGFGWDGTFSASQCEGNCFRDFLQVNEANVGVNKVNYYVNRDMHLNIDLSEDTVKHILAVNITNSAFGGSDKNTYKTYLRALVPDNSNFTEGELLKDGKSEKLLIEESIIRNKKEGGVYVEIPPGRSVVVIFRWSVKKEMDFNREGEYRLNWEKQAGTNYDPITVNINSPILTQDLSRSYNTTLTRDFEATLNW